MADIEALKFGESVKSSNDLLGQTLKEKGIEPSSSLLGKVQQVNQLSENENRYVPDPYFDKMEEEFANDPLRKENGGPYEYCTYNILLKLADTAYISRDSFIGASTAEPVYFVCSDGQTFTKTNSITSESFTITFNDTNIEDMKLQTGEYVRWIKVYTNKYSTSGNNILPCNTLSSISQNDYNYQQLVCAITNKDTAFAGTTSIDSRCDIYVNHSLRYLIFWDNVDTWNFGNSNYNCSIAQIDCIKLRNPKVTIANMGSAVNGLGVPYVKHFNIIPIKYNGSLPNTAFNIINVNNLDLSHLDLSSMGTNINLYLVNNSILSNKLPGSLRLFRNYQSPIPSPINLDSIIIDKYSSSCLLKIAPQWEVNLQLTLYSSIYFSTKEIVDIVNNLKDFSDTIETRTLTIPSSYLTLLAPEIIAEANRKGWTVSGA